MSRPLPRPVVEVLEVVDAVVHYIGLALAALVTPHRRTDPACRLAPPWPRRRGPRRYWFDLNRGLRCGPCFGRDATGPREWLERLFDELEVVAIRALRVIVERDGDHVRADPGCRQYRPPSGRLSRWWTRHNSGRDCPYCRRVAVRVLSARDQVDGPVEAEDLCVRTIDRLTCSTHGEPWPCSRLGQARQLEEGDGGPCPLDCGRWVARVLLDGHLEAHRIRGDVGGDR